MNHFEAHLMVSSREVDSKYSGWQLVILMTKKQDGECNVRNFRRFSLGVSSDVLEFIVPVLQVTLNFKFEVNEYL